MLDIPIELLLVLILILLIPFQIASVKRMNRKQRKDFNEAVRLVIRGGN
jgi:hypothetical protein